MATIVGHVVKPHVHLEVMPQLVDARVQDDDWTGLADAAARRKKQNRLNVRAYRRRRKAMETKTSSASAISDPLANPENQVPCWVENKQAVMYFPLSVAEALNSLKPPSTLSQSNDLSRQNFRSSQQAGVVIPLSSDHLMSLIQYNVLRACLANVKIVFGDDMIIPQNHCADALLHVLASSDLPNAVPPSLQPTQLQLMIPHESWLDIIPHPVWRDNFLLALGTFDEDEVCSDIVGGLFEDVPAPDAEASRLIVWNPPWDICGWELSEGFLKKWGWSLIGCEDILEATNKWRRQRDEKPIGIGWKLPRFTGSIVPIESTDS